MQKYRYLVELHEHKQAVRPHTSDPVLFWFDAGPFAGCETVNRHKQVQCRVQPLSIRTTSKFPNNTHFICFPALRGALWHVTLVTPCCGQARLSRIRESAHISTVNKTRECKAYDCTLLDILLLKDLLAVPEKDRLLKDLPRLSVLVPLSSGSTIIAACERSAATSPELRCISWVSLGFAIPLTSCQRSIEQAWVSYQTTP